MFHPARYSIILIFVLIVIIAMFFIYSNIASGEKIEPFETTPSWFQKANCIVRGGAIEKEASYYSQNQIIDIDNPTEVDVAYNYLCHYR
jgi:hypothetical protein